MAQSQTSPAPQRASAGASKGLGWAIAGLVGFMGIGLGAFFAYTRSHTPIPVLEQGDYAARTEMILRSTPLIDGHNDLPFVLRLELHNQIYDNKTFSFRESEAGPGAITLILAIKVLNKITDNW